MSTNELPPSVTLFWCNGWCKTGASQRVEVAVYRAVSLSMAVGLLLPAGCSEAPSQNVFGSFFPAWMLCTGVGILAALVCRVIMGAVGLDKQLLAPPLAYLAVAVAVTLFAWLYRFGQ